jgi:rare lipoprotein A
MGRRGTVAACVAFAFVIANGVAPADAALRHHRHHTVRVRTHQLAVDHSGRRQQGHASYYAPKFTGRRTAAGGHFDPNSDSAASKTLPLGTTAKVTNLENGRTATVTVQDRGPHLAGRIVDVSPRTADRLALKKSGVSPVAVDPIAVPQPDGSVKPGSAVQNAPH